VCSWHCPFQHNFPQSSPAAAGLLLLQPLHRYRDHWIVPVVMME
jgi:hypothetical protein